MDEIGFAGDSEMAEALDPNIGSGTPESAPSMVPFDDDDDLDDVEVTRGEADLDDDDQVEDNGTGIDADI